jgi:hypothetical protein
VAKFGNSENFQEKLKQNALPKLSAAAGGQRSARLIYCFSSEFSSFHSPHEMKKLAERDRSKSGRVLVLPKRRSIDGTLMSLDEALTAP